MKATNEADKSMYKLLNNTVFRKTCENLLNRTEDKLVNTHEDAMKYIKKPTFKDYTIYNESLSEIHLDRTCVTLNKPSFVGVAVLELSKVLMYEFFYFYIKTKYGDNAKLLMTDTDSEFLEIKTDDEDIRDNIPTMFDTSAYPENHPSGLPRMNKKVIGLMKDE